MIHLSVTSRSDGARRHQLVIPYLCTYIVVNERSMQKKSSWAPVQDYTLLERVKHK